MSSNSSSEWQQIACVFGRKCSSGGVVECATVRGGGGCGGVVVGDVDAGVHAIVMCECGDVDGSVGVVDGDGDIGDVGDVMSDGDAGSVVLLRVVVVVLL